MQLRGTCRSVEGVEDTPLVSGRGYFADDVGERPGTAHAAVLRAPHVHAGIVSLDATAAHSMPEVVTVLTGEDITAWSRPFMAGVRQAMRHYPLAVDRVRYVGEPVAVSWPVAVTQPKTHSTESKSSTENSTRSSTHSQQPPPTPPCSTPMSVPTSSATATSATATPAPPSQPPTNASKSPSATPATPAPPSRDSSWWPSTSGRTATTSCPTSRPVLTAPGDGSRARGPRLAPTSSQPPGFRRELRRQAGHLPLHRRDVPRVTESGVPVKWVEDRIEHLVAATSATNRVTTLEAAVTNDGAITALRWDQLDDCGAYLRAPEPASLYRTHGHMTGPYRIPNLEIRNRVVLTSKTPTGLNRGFGGPQVYFALERLMHRIAKTLGLDPLDVIRRNLVPKEAFPYRAASGSLLDSGDYATALDMATGDGRLARLRARRDAARAEGRRYGIGFAAVVEPSISNMGYITMALTPEERERAGPKDGAAACATVAIDPIGSITVQADSVPQGQGHRTVLARVVADVLGVGLEDITVNTELVDSQIRGGFARGRGAAVYEELAYADDGSFLSGALADYLVPNAGEVPNPIMLHVETPSPFTPLGATFTRSMCDRAPPAALPARPARPDPSAVPRRAWRR